MEAGAKANSAICVLVSTEDAEKLGERQRRTAKGDKDYRKHLMGERGLESTVCLAYQKDWKVLIREKNSSRRQMSSLFWWKRMNA